MGHAMREVDEEYFIEIARQIAAHKVKWIISYYYQSDIVQATKTLAAAGINPSLVRFIKMQDFFSPQLSLFTP